MTIIFLKGEHDISNPYIPGEHRGVDITHNINEDENVVYPNCDGEVIATLDNIPNGSEEGGGWGNYVLVRHPNGMTSRYAHLKSGLPVSVGDLVDENTRIGIIGDSGRAYGRHLHFEVSTDYSAANRIDPTPYLEKRIWEKPEPPIPPVRPLQIGDKVKIIDTGKATCYGEEPTAYGIGWIRTIKDIYDKRPYPYQVGDETGTTGFYKEEALERVD